MPESAVGTAVLLLAHGTPESVDQMTDYLRLVRGGREPSSELIEEMTHNWEAIGGRSPLTDITMQQAEALQAQLAADGLDMPVAVGMRNWRPFIADAMRDIIRTGARRVIGIPMAPQFSTLSVKKYIEAAQAALPAGVEFSCVQSFHDHPLLVEAFAQRVLAAERRADEEIVFTAHSLPQRVVESGDPYPNEVAATAKAVAKRCGIASYDIAYQSAGRTPEPWLGPDLSEHIQSRSTRDARSALDPAAGAPEGRVRMLVVPVGFVCDHTEILFDIDVQAAATARAAGVELRRTESLNTSPTFIRALADLASSAISRQTSVISRQSTVDSRQSQSQSESQSQSQSQSESTVVSRRSDSQDG